MARDMYVFLQILSEEYLYLSSQGLSNEIFVKNKPVNTEISFFLYDTSIYRLK
jgi:hypothetical protein